MTNDRDFETVREICERVRNWGKWGPDDQVGTVNYITPAKVVEAARLVRTGKVFSLAIPFDHVGPQSGKLNRRFNPMRFMLQDGRDTLAGPGRFPQGYGGADDVVALPTHAATHWDGLSHQFWDGKMWNGYDAGLVSSLGAEKNGVEHFRRLVTRGVLLDMPRLRGVEYLDLGDVITVEDLEAAAALGNVEVGTGDIVLVRTGRVGYCLAKGDWSTCGAGLPAPGLSFWTVDWLHRREVAGVATDTYPAEVQPGEVKWISHPWHKATIPNMGLLVGELFDLEELARDCAADGVYEFQFVAPALPLVGSTGSPINPMAVK